MLGSDPPGSYNVVTPASHKLQNPLPDNIIYRINTGGALPEGADSVIMVEDTALISTEFIGTEDVKVEEEKVVQTLAQVRLGENVRAVGSDVKKGDLILRKGEILRVAGGEIGSLAFVGCDKVRMLVK